MRAQRLRLSRFVLPPTILIVHKYIAQLSFKSFRGTQALQCAADLSDRAMVGTNP